MQLYYDIRLDIIRTVNMTDLIILLFCLFLPIVANLHNNSLSLESVSCVQKFLCKRVQIFHSYIYSLTCTLLVLACYKNTKYSISLLVMYEINL